MTGTELLPCPFCGGPASHTGAAVRCNNFACNTTMTPRWTKDVVGSAKGDPDVRFALAKADCMRRWNQRGEAAPTTTEAARVLLAACPNPIFDHLKPILIGEVKETITYPDEDGDEASYEQAVSWTAMKEIIQRALRALSKERDHG
ncbi:MULTISPECIES: hypothetical protein [Paracoccus]|uniref:hypothetical protein n=1 Tax=Paracoccus TaxID=265 RepID=UPI00258428CA|nr:hypothetical protein [Paracoccus sp. (in: a-proteobacteria)]